LRADRFGIAMVKKYKAGGRAIIFMSGSLIASRSRRSKIALAVED
jgi:hypothetical protein